MKPNLCTYLRKNIYSRLSEVGRLEDTPHIKCVQHHPMAWYHRLRIKEKVSWPQALLTLCFLSMNAVRPAASNASCIIEFTTHIWLKSEGIRLMYQKSPQASPHPKVRYNSFILSLQGSLQFLLTVFLTISLMRAFCTFSTEIGICVNYHRETKLELESLCSLPISFQYSKSSLDYSNYFWNMWF